MGSIPIVASKGCERNFAPTVSEKRGAWQPAGRLVRVQATFLDG